MIVQVSVVLNRTRLLTVTDMTQKKTKAQVVETSVTVNNSPIRDFSGNSDRNTVVTNCFRPSILARYVRVHPKTWYGHISMRIELLGCASGNVNWHNGNAVVSSGSSDLPIY